MLDDCAELRIGMNQGQATVGVIAEHRDMLRAEMPRHQRNVAGLHRGQIGSDRHRRTEVLAERGPEIIALGVAAIRSAVIAGGAGVGQRSDHQTNAIEVRCAAALMAELHADPGARGGDE